MKKREKRSSIQIRYLKYTVCLLLSAMVLCGAGVSWVVQKNQETVMMDNYNTMCENLGAAMDLLFEKTDEATADCIVYDGVQKSLRKAAMSRTQRSALSRYFAFINLDDVAEYCYVDNKKNVYTRSYSKLTYHKFRESDMERFLQGSYATTTWFWTKDTLFGTGKDALFIGRYIRNMNYEHEPGMLFLKMDPVFFQNITGDSDLAEEGILMQIMDADGEVCFQNNDSDEARKPLILAKERILATEGNGMIISRGKIGHGMLCAYRQKESGMIVSVYVPDHVLHAGMGRIMTVMLLIFLFTMVLALILSVYFSRILSLPIQKISKKMAGFHGNDYTRMEELHTKTELDQIGHSYNEMLGNIEQLVAEVKSQEKELRTVEVNMLLNQMNPHFLYNTLDTIYMLARINKEETTMRMIQALSKYLRLSLSKGEEIVSVADELENVRNYMEIQQIRNADLFRYEIHCEVDADKERMLKLVLQPLVENAIKYGFDGQSAHYRIEITVRREEEELVLTSYNSGTPIAPDACEKINGLMQMSIAEMKESFKTKKNGYGLVNVLTRLRLAYEGRVSFYVIAKEDGTTFVIRIPRLVLDRV